MPLEVFFPETYCQGSRFLDSIERERNTDFWEMQDTVEHIWAIVPSLKSQIKKKLFYFVI
jgi:hypothetical protein